jgi:hypothetical protein
MVVELEKPGKTGFVAANRLLKNVEWAARLLAFPLEKHRRAARATAFSTGC